MAPKRHAHFTFRLFQVFVQNFVLINALPTASPLLSLTVSFPLSLFLSRSRARSLSRSRSRSRSLSLARALSLSLSLARAVSWHLAPSFSRSLSYINPDGAGIRRRQSPATRSQHTVLASISISGIASTIA